MKLTNKKILYSGAVNGKIEMTIEATEAEIQELKNALVVVNRFKKVLKVKEKDADFNMYKFNCGKKTVVVTVEQGACG
jgi:methyl coenzyme M reductase beta subunit